jgi:hypothetical protein
MNVKNILELYYSYLDLVENYENTNFVVFFAGLFLCCKLVALICFSSCYGDMVVDISI